jgi:hypothetical protein
MLFEPAAYAAGFRLTLRERRRLPTTAVLRLSVRLALITGAILGAAIGSRLSWWVQDVHCLRVLSQCGDSVGASLVPLNSSRMA